LDFEARQTASPADTGLADPSAPADTGLADPTDPANPASTGGSHA